jgi:hypothetical protein
MLEGTVIVNMYHNSLFIARWKVRLGDYDLSDAADDVVAVERDILVSNWRKFNSCRRKLHRPPAAVIPWFLGRYSETGLSLFIL